jgi:hypothetical protein
MLYAAPEATHQYPLHLPCPLQKLGHPRHMSSQEAAMGRKGILLFEGVKSLPDTPAVFTLWDGQTTVEPGNDYWGEARNVMLWELPSGGA